MKLLANVGYLQDHPMESQQWKRDGALVFNPSTGKFLLKKIGTRLGMFIAKPDPTKWPELPFAQGHLEMTIDMLDDNPVIMYIGWITTTEVGHRKETAYSIHISNLPNVNKKSGMWIPILTEADDGYDYHSNGCPF